VTTRELLTETDQKLRGGPVVRIRIYA
jgi:hypothetical protein